MHFFTFFLHKTITEYDCCTIGQNRVTSAVQRSTNMMQAAFKILYAYLLQWVHQHIKGTFIAKYVTFSIFWKSIFLFSHCCFEVSGSSALPLSSWFCRLEYCVLKDKLQIFFNFAKTKNFDNIKQYKFYWNVKVRKIITSDCSD